MKIVSQSFFILAEKKPRALVAIKDIKTDSCPYSIWAASQGIVFGKIFEEGMVGWRYCPFVDADQNIIGLRFLGDSLLDDEVLFRTLAPYVRDGSYLDIVTSDKKWTWSFQDGQMFCQSYVPTVDNK